MRAMENHPYGSLDELDEFRNSKFNYMYVCKNCSRSFDTVSMVSQCKFCGSEDVHLVSGKKAGNFRYYCPVCEKNYVTHVKIKNCEFCGSRHIHITAMEGTQRDEMRTRVSRFFSSFWKKYDEAGTKKVEIRETREIRETGKGRFEFFEKIKRPEFRFSFMRGSGEEMPTDAPRERSAKKKSFFAQRGDEEEPTS